MGKKKNNKKSNKKKNNQVSKAKQNNQKKQNKPQCAKKAFDEKNNLPKGNSSQVKDKKVAEKELIADNQVALAAPDIEENAVDLDVNGVGYHISTPTRTAEAAASLTEMLLYTVLIVKEDEMSLFGFETRQEKSMFEKLISISGVGPKAAQSILSGKHLKNIMA